MRKYQLATLHLSTAGGISQIDLITKTDAINLKQMIQNKKTIQQNDINEMTTTIDRSNLPSEWGLSMIYGIGIDLIEIERIKNAFEKQTDKLVKRILTQ